MYNNNSKKLRHDSMNIFEPWSDMPKIKTKFVLGRIEGKYKCLSNDQFVFRKGIGTRKATLTLLKQ